MLFMVTNRRRHAGTFGGNILPRGEVTYLSGPDLKSGAAPFRRRLLDRLSREKADLSHEGADAYQVPRVVGVFHGYNNGWGAALEFADRLDRKLTSQLPGADHAATVGFSWPSEGDVLHYLDDRHMARESSPAVTRTLVDAFRLLERERCEAELALVAHSMGCYVLATAARDAWELQGFPQTRPVFSEIILAGADLDANALEPGRVGEALPVFARRVTVYYSRQDRALVASSAKRAGVTGARLGRTGPARLDRVPRNVVAVDVSALTVDQGAGGVAPHSAHFHHPRILEDMRATLAGHDRQVIDGRQANGSSLSLDRGARAFEIAADA